jgi:hypothetical protein
MKNTAVFFVLLLATSLAIAQGSATLTWVPPTKNVDGSALTDLASYRVSWGTAQGVYPNSALVSNPAATSFVVSPLAAANWFFVVTAINSAGRESAFSNVATKTVAAGTTPSPPSGVALAQSLAFALQTSRDATLALEIGKVSQQTPWSTAIYFRTSQAPVGTYCMVPKASVTFLAGQDSEAVFVQCGN